MLDMVKLHARVTIEVEVPKSVFRELIGETSDYNGLCDYDLRESDAEYFLSCGKIDKEWDDLGYIPSNWLTYDAVESGLYEADENGIRSVCNEE